MCGGYLTQRRHRVARLDQQPERNLRLGHLDRGGGDVHDVVGPLKALEGFLQVSLVSQVAALVHQGAGGLAVGCAGGRMPCTRDGERRGHECRTGERKAACRDHCQLTPAFVSGHEHV